jgi:IS605 OrfB family transposase
MSATRTFQTRVDLDPIADEVFCELSKYFAHIKHCLFAEITSGKKANSLKNDYLLRFEITARQFNAIRVEVEGKISSIKQRLILLIKEKKDRIISLQKKIKYLIKAKADPHLIHQKKRRLGNLQQQLERLLKDQKNETIRLCFGSKKLFNSQFNLEANGYNSHEEWLKEWKRARTKELFFLGSKDETSGNQTCTASLEEDAIALRIRLPNALAAKYGKYIRIAKLNFQYGKEELLTALKNWLEERSQAISWRMLRDQKSWRFFATFEISQSPCTSDNKLGAIGVDINTNHLALAETDSFGNIIGKTSIPFILNNKDFNQTRAIIGDAVAQAIAWSEKKNKPIVVEDLDFQEKKGSLRESRSAKYARMLSSFAYQSILMHIKSRAMKKGISVASVNPAFTSMIGRLKYARRYGLTIHEAAAFAIARRYLGVYEKIPSGPCKTTDGKDGHVTFSVPVRNQGEHVWSFWRKLNKKLQAALKAHFRTVKKSRSSSSVMEACAI